MLARPVGDYVVDTRPHVASSSERLRVAFATNLRDSPAHTNPRRKHRGRTQSMCARRCMRRLLGARSPAIGGERDRADADINYRLASRRLLAAHRHPQRASGGTCQGKASTCIPPRVERGGVKLLLLRNTTLGARYTPSLSLLALAAPAARCSQRHRALSCDIGLRDGRRPSGSSAGGTCKRIHRVETRACA